MEQHLTIPTPTNTMSSIWDVTRNAVFKAGQSTAYAARTIGNTVATNRIATATKAMTAGVPMPKFSCANWNAYVAAAVAGGATPSAAIVKIASWYGFGTTGITAGSSAAAAMSATAVAGGTGGVAAGSAVAVGQTIGATSSLVAGIGVWPVVAIVGTGAATTAVGVHLYCNRYSKL